MTGIPDMAKWTRESILWNGALGIVLLWCLVTSHTTFEFLFTLFALAILVWVTVTECYILRSMSSKGQDN